MHLLGYSIHKHEKTRDQRGQNHTQKGVRLSAGAALERGDPPSRALDRDQDRPGGRDFQDAGAGGTPQSGAGRAHRIDSKGGVCGQGYQQG